MTAKITELLAFLMASATSCIETVALACGENAILKFGSPAPEQSKYWLAIGDLENWPATLPDVLSFCCNEKASSNTWPYSPAVLASLMTRILFACPYKPRMEKLAEPVSTFTGWPFLRVI